MSWLWLSLLCAFSLASADAATKRYLSDYSAVELALARFVFTALLLLPFLLFQPTPRLPLAFWAWVGFLVPLEVLAMLLYMEAIRTSALSQTLPYLAFTPVFSVLTGWLLLGETVSPAGFFGIASVAVGAYLLNVDRAFAPGSYPLLAPIKEVFDSTGPRLMLAVAALYSVTSVLEKGLLGYAPPLFFGPFYFVLLGVVAASMALVARPRSLAAVMRRPAAHIIVGIAMAAMVLTHYLALNQVEVAYMIAVKRTSVLFGILYGALLFGEKQLPQHLAAGAIIVLGVALIAA
ncbi:MAG: EamA family transporter [Gammaproteobacteria bacterium]